jgi:uncharacterized protein (TIGR02270 family)
LWGIRRKAVKSQKYRLRDLARADERVEAHLEGLEVSGADGWARLVDDLELGLPGAIFAGSVWALRTGDVGRFGALLDSAQDDRARLDAVVSGFGWAFSGGTADDRPELPSSLVGQHSLTAAAQLAKTNQPPADTWARRLLADDNPSSRYVAVGAFAVCRVSPSDGELNALLVKESHVPTVARAARMVGELGLAHAVTPVEYLLGHAAPEVRQAAAWSLSVLQAQAKAPIPILMAAAQDEEPNPDILDMAGRRLPAAQVQAWTRELSQSGRVRAALLVSAASGAPALIDDLLPHMAPKETARLAGFAFSQITGADLVKLDLELQDAPADKAAKVAKASAPAQQVDAEVEGLEDDAAPSKDEEEDRHLPVPDPNRVAEWWRQHKAELSPTARYLAGRPMTDPGLRQTLIEGTQPQRRAAAVELACLIRRGPVYNTSQPGFMQARELLGWT